MPLDALLDALAADTAERVAAIRAEAERRAAASREVAAAACRDHLAAQEQLLVAAAERELEPVRRAAAAKVLAARHRLVDRVFEAARAALPDLPPADVVARTLSEALACVPEPAVVRCRPAVADAVRHMVAGRDVVVEPDPAAAPGLVIRSADGAVAVDATLASRLDALRPALAHVILAGVSP